MAIAAQAATLDIAVTAAGDAVYWRSWGGGANYVWTDEAANPNRVSHNWDSGYGEAANAGLSFDLAALSGKAAGDISSVTLSFTVLDLWTQGRDDIGVLGSGGVAYGTVLASAGTGLKFFDVTDPVKAAVAASAGTVGFNFSYTGYSGFTFGSAEGGLPATLSVQSVGAVPEPQSVVLMLAGLGMLGWVAARRGPRA